ncbi:enoyl-CoA hydratase/isomerase family protein [Nocardia nova SH22a]|uniref:Enoyl-CoA hydratase/isomerase family protein n=1 Tax=Nocardia nova SH22a TaxID=1415166 RepID=W5TN73_9NOCA|nr:enoyl-CoA hydratase-related protein [Nocardia nova]AHH18701.1 enoyl-CoA hydratase/isomerase family protein [Nocardia nova SH22a]
MPHLRREGSVYIVHLGGEGERDTENRFHPDWLTALHAIIDEAVASPGPAALVTVGDGKFYSTGADLAWGAAHPDRIDRYLTDVQGLLARILTLPMPTVAAVNGHAFGAGAFLTVAHDYRIMRADRGYVCFPGVALGADYARGSIELMRSRMPAPVAHHALVSGRRYGGGAALGAGLVDAIAAESEVLPSAVRYAEQLAHTRGPVLAHIKSTLHREAVCALTESVAGYNNHTMVSAPAAERESADVAIG